jgi:hypothetical protein
VVETSLRKDISISVASAGADKNVEDITVHLKSNNTHIMCKGLDDVQPQIIDKNSDGELLCQDNHNMFASVKYKATTSKFSKAWINLFVKNQRRQDYGFKCNTTIDNSASDSEVLQTMAVQCYTPVSSHLKEIPKFPSRKEEQTFDCFNVSIDNVWTHMFATPCNGVIECHDGSDEIWCFLPSWLDPRLIFLIAFIAMAFALFNFLTNTLLKVFSENVEKAIKSWFPISATNKIQGCPQTQS